MNIENIAFYRFTEITEENLPLWREQLREACRRLGLGGTILLSREGINGFLAGEIPAIAQIKDLICTYPGMEGMDYKVSYSAEIPFRRMLVKIKKEIIPMGVESIRPKEKTAPRLEPEDLKRWLDEGKEVVLLDTRNQFEVDVGTFKGAKSWGLKTFREFRDELANHRQELEGKPVVMFCTGGIRCEKAGALGMDLGLETYQLEGGILRYFEKVGGDHYEGDCFVFDRRVALDSQLKPSTRHAQCWDCRSVSPSSEPCGH
jgi:UPF0176 protein